MKIKFKIITLSIFTFFGKNLIISMYDSNITIYKNNFTDSILTVKTNLPKSALFLQQEENIEEKNQEISILKEFNKDLCKEIAELKKLNKNLSYEMKKKDEKILLLEGFSKDLFGEIKKIKENNNNNNNNNNQLNPNENYEYKTIINEQKERINQLKCANRILSKAYNYGVPTNYFDKSGFYEAIINEQEKTINKLKFANRILFKAYNYGLPTNYFDKSGFSDLKISDLKIKDLIYISKKFFNPLLDATFNLFIPL